MSVIAAFPPVAKNARLGQLSRKELIGKLGQAPRGNGLRFHACQLNGLVSRAELDMVAVLPGYFVGDRPGWIGVKQDLQMFRIGKAERSPSELLPHAVVAFLAFDHRPRRELKLQLGMILRCRLLPGPGKILRRGQVRITGKTESQ